jgi:hypothetical protein
MGGGLSFDLGRAPGFVILFMGSFHSIDEARLAFFTDRALAITFTGPNSQMLVLLAKVTHSLRKSVLIALRTFRAHENGALGVEFSTTF